MLLPLVTHLQETPITLPSSQVRLSQNLIKRVAIEASSASSGGAIRFLSQICPALSKDSSNITYYLLNRTEQRSQLPALPHNFHWIRIPDQTRWIPFRLLWLQVVLPRILTEIGADVLLAASDVSTLRSPCPMVLMSHNINPFSPLRGQIWRRKQLVRMAAHRRLIKACSRRADKVVFVSNWSRQAMLPYLNISQEKTSVVYHGVDEVFRPFPKRVAPDNAPRIILAVSEVLEHKNLARLIEAFIQLSKSSHKEVRLIIAGGIGSEELRQSLEARLTNEGILDRVTFLGFVPKEELAVWYHQAELLVFPSLAETFGLPLIEAMASGLPVVASNATAMPEICQKAALYFDPENILEMDQAIQRVLTEPDLRDELIRQGIKRASSFSWEDTAANLLSSLEMAQSRAS